MLLRYFILANLHGIADVCQLCAPEGSHVAIPWRVSQEYAVILQGTAVYVTAYTMTLLLVLYISGLRLS